MGAPRRHPFGGGTHPPPPSGAELPPPPPRRLEAGVQNLSIHTRTASYAGKGGSRGCASPPRHPKLLSTLPFLPPPFLLQPATAGASGGASGAPSPVATPCPPRPWRAPLWPSRAPSSSRRSRPATASWCPSPPTCWPTEPPRAHPEPFAAGSGPPGGMGPPPDRTPPGTLLLSCPEPGPRRPSVRPASRCPSRAPPVCLSRGGGRWGPPPTVTPPSSYPPVQGWGCRGSCNNKPLGTHSVPACWGRRGASKGGASKGGHQKGGTKGFWDGVKGGGIKGGGRGPCRPQGRAAGIRLGCQESPEGAGVWGARIRPEGVPGSTQVSWAPPPAMQSRAPLGAPINYCAR